jgi:hypothetical protein
MYVKTERTLNVNFETDTEKRIVENFLSKLLLEIKDLKPDDLYDFLLDLADDLVGSDENEKDFVLYF